MRKACGVVQCVRGWRWASALLMLYLCLTPALYSCFVCAGGGVPLMPKKSERAKQDFELKPQKIKALPDNLIIEKPIENFEELKNNSVSHQQQIINMSNQGKIKKNDILLNLVKLGIIKR